MKVLPLLLIAYILIQSVQASAEFKCSSEISYKWTSSFKAQEGKESANTDSGNSSEQNKNEEMVYYQSVLAQGENADLAKENLGKQIPPMKEKAAQQCKLSHENKAACIATKFDSMDAVLNKLDFKARSELQRVIMHDCDLQTGKCLEVVASEPDCKEIGKADEKKTEGVEAEKAKEAGAPGTEKKVEKGVAAKKK
ncbi:MAG: hypothetical protein GYA55_04835 [SAR324 cluster bacterium]|uniref:DUF4124 domain-containing protein n=1 Tax=SAR324 cluster bacterium TaxID=2024889 RepID=A0A7X9IL03_9DELT|nr:hypothetical protein [SAR324 cluster bacterium]